MSKNPLAAARGLMQHHQCQPSPSGQGGDATPPSSTEMKPSHTTLRGTVVAAAAAVLISTFAHGAPKKPEPAPVVEQSAPEKKGMFGKVKSALSFKKKEVSPVVETVPAESAKPASKEKAAPAVKGKPAPALVAPKPVAAVEIPGPEKKGFVKRLFTKSTGETPDEPNLAKAKTAKPAPVKEVKPNGKLAGNSPDEPQKKRGLFGFLHGGSKSLAAAGTSDIPDTDKIVRPNDWAEHRVVQDDEVAIYSFGPSQSQGPDERLSRGTLVKLKTVTKGWALVDVQGGRSGYMDASLLRSAEMNDFAEPPAPAMASLDLNLKAWAPAAPPPDLPDQPGAMDNSGALLLLPPLELEPKP